MVLCNIYSLKIINTARKATFSIRTLLESLNSRSVTKVPLIVVSLTGVIHGRVTYSNVRYHNVSYGDVTSRRVTNRNVIRYRDVTYLRALPLSVWRHLNVLEPWPHPLQSGPSCL